MSMREIYLRTLELTGKGAVSGPLMSPKGTINSLLDENDTVILIASGGLSKLALALISYLK